MTHSPSLPCALQHMLFRISVLGVQRVILQIFGCLGAIGASLGMNDSDDSSPFFVWYGVFGMNHRAFNTVESSSHSSKAIIHFLLSLVESWVVFAFPHFLDDLSLLVDVYACGSSFFIWFLVRASALQMFLFYYILFIKKHYLDLFSADECALVVMVRIRLRVLWLEGYRFELW